MRKLKLQVQISIDGFIAGEQGEMDWMLWNWGDDIKQYVQEITDPVDTILLGKNLAEGFIPYWTEAYKLPEQVEGAKKFVETPKIVFSKTINESVWDNTQINNGNLLTEINALKAQSGSDMIAYGGAKFVSALIKEQLIDEMHLFINPSVLGKGLPIFQDLTERQNYTLKKSVCFNCGIIVLQYQLAP